MPPKGKKAGRPAKYRTEEERKLARRASNQRLYQRRHQQALQRQQPATLESLQVQLDPLSVLERAGPEGNRQITAADQEIQVDEGNKPVDEVQQELLQVVVRLRFLPLSNSNQ